MYHCSGWCAFSWYTQRPYSHSNIIQLSILHMVMFGLFTRVTTTFRTHKPIFVTEIVHSLYKSCWLIGIWQMHLCCWALIVSTDCNKTFEMLPSSIFTLFIVTIVIVIYFWLVWDYHVHRLLYVKAVVNETIWESHVIKYSYQSLIICVPCSKNTTIKLWIISLDRYIFLFIKTCCPLNVT